MLTLPIPSSLQIPAVLLQIQPDSPALSFFYFKVGTIIFMLGYLLGSIPFGYIVGRMHGIDIRDHGSGNIGATNVFRTLGRRPGIFVFVCDALKGLFAVVLGKWIAGRWRIEAIDDRSRDVILLFLPVAVGGIIAAIACILGHNFPVWLKFKGGKGIATTAGVLIGLMPWAVLIVLIVWAIVFYTTGYVSLASILAAIALPVAVLMLLLLGGATGWPLFYFAMLAAIMAIWRHRANIQRLIAGTEPQFRSRNRQDESPPEVPRPAGAAEVEPTTGQIPTTPVAPGASPPPPRSSSSSSSPQP